MQKIQFKTFSNVSLDAYLFKNFKFYDLHSQGYLSKADFFRAIAKCGVVVETHVHLSELRTSIQFTMHMHLRTEMYTISSSYKTSSSKNQLLPAKAESITNPNPRESLNKAKEILKKNKGHLSNLELISSTNVRPTLKSWDT